MSSWREQTVIDAPVEEVWTLVGDPNRYPEWAADVLEVTGLPRVDRGAAYSQRTRLPFGSTTTTFQVEELDELREIHLRCTRSGYYSRCLLTEARGSTFAELELGIEPQALRGRAAGAMMGKRWYRRLAAKSLAGLRRAVEAHRPR